jgi:short-subunit dehydrogenase
MHALITGASKGIGAALARELAAHGARVTLVARSRDKLEALAAELPTPSHVVAEDLARLDRATAWLPQAEAALGPVDVLINNAGLHIAAPTHGVSADDAERLLAVNLLAPLRLTRAVLGGMRARGSGTIVDVTSVAAFAPLPSTYDYSASKAGLAAASESLRGELRGTGVHVVTVYPGPVRTEMGVAAQKKLGDGLTSRLMPWGTPEGLAKRVRRAIARRRKRVIYPWCYTITRHLPGVTQWSLELFSPVARGPVS